MTAAFDEAKQVAVRVLGHEGRMMYFSKSGYVRTRPTNLAVFNSRVVVALSDGYCENVWWGDLDLTLWEERLVVLARLLGKRVYLLYEGDDRGSYPREPGEFALACFSPGRQVEIPERHSSYVVRADDGTLRRFIPPVARRRWRWRVLVHRPRLWRFWMVERKKRSDQTGTRRLRSTLIYSGGRDGEGASLLALGRFRATEWSSTNRWLEWTWYPSGAGKRAASRPLLNLRPQIRIGPITVWLHLLVWPASTYQLYLGVTNRRTA